MNLNMFEKMGFLTECFATCVTFERLLSCVCPEMNLDIGFIEEATIADIAAMNGLLLPVVHHIQGLTGRG